MNKKKSMFDLNDFVLCPDGEFGKIKVFLRDEEVEVDRKSGKHNFLLKDLTKLKEDIVYCRDELNTKLFKDDMMIPEVRAKLIGATEDFLQEMTKNMTSQAVDLLVEDILLVGSNASYNYSDFSDIDIHILYNPLNLGDELSLFFAKEYFETFRRLFNQSHQITVYGLPVEFYAEDITNEGIYNGKYSVLNDKWVKFPDKEKVNVNSADIEAKFDLYKSDIESYLEIPGQYENALELYKKIFKMRRAALHTGGEFCTENLAFKKLRNEGWITKLRDYIRNERDKSLSVESLREMFAECIKGNLDFDDIFTED